MSSVIDITGFRRVTKPTDLNYMRALEPETIHIHDHRSKRTAFTIWMAVNRRRSGIKFRSTRKDVAGVLPMTIEARNNLPQGYYVRRSRTGQYQFFYSDEVETAKVRRSEVPDLPEGLFAIWRDRERKK